jgi:hypothetical protein
MAHLTKQQYDALVALVGIAETSGWASKGELKNAKAAIATIPYLSASGTAVQSETLATRLSYHSTPASYQAEKDEVDRIREIVKAEIRRQIPTLASRDELSERITALATEHRASVGMLAAGAEWTVVLHDIDVHFDARVDALSQRLDGIEQRVGYGSRLAHDWAEWYKVDPEAAERWRQEWRA